MGEYESQSGHYESQEEEDDFDYSQSNMSEEDY